MVGANGGCEWWVKRVQMKGKWLLLYVVYFVAEHVNLIVDKIAVTTLSGYRKKNYVEVIRFISDQRNEKLG